MHILLFGGTFDPPHLAHHQITLEVLKQKIGDAVWYVPLKRHPFAKEISSSQDRLAMLKLLSQEEKNYQSQIRIEEFELHREEMSYSFDTLEALSAQYPEHVFSWLVGSDNVAAFLEWHRAEELLKKYKVFVYPRRGFAFEQKELPTGMILLKNVPEEWVSSTEVREKVQKGEPITGLVVPSVEQYIKSHQLYKTQ